MHLHRQARQVKRSNHSICWLIAMIFALATAGAGRGQSVTILHSFGGGNPSPDGAVPEGALIQNPDGSLDGMTSSGGASDGGSAFTISTQGALASLHQFGDGKVTNDGLNPPSSLIRGPNGDFYGTTPNGGSKGNGTVFELNSSGGMTILHSFGDGSVANDGLNPTAGLVQGLDGNLYGTTPKGGAASAGTVSSSRRRESRFSIALETARSFRMAPRRRWAWRRMPGGIFTERLPAVERAIREPSIKSIRWET